MSKRRQNIHAQDRRQRSGSVTIQKLSAQPAGDVLALLGQRLHEASQAEYCATTPSYKKEGDHFWIEIPGMFQRSAR